jgi:hypothetical protein
MESLDNPFRDRQKEKRGSPLVESPSKLCKIKALKVKITKKVSLRNIDSVFPGSGAKMLSCNLYLSLRERPRK